ncbi:hypothetical protein [Caenispirillum salinarum]|uniref:hypothetical protein n=1 Tax=Caenispirillum salinarum TaxID=859058 RepID=UPI0038512E0E
MSTVGSLMPAAALLVVSVLGVFVAGLWPRETGPVAVLAADFPAAVAVVEAAGGRLVGGTGVDGLVVAAPRDPADTGLRDRLSAAGAWILLDPQGLAGCGVTLPDGLS